MGKLIVIEGTDGTGKSTQMAKLTERLRADGCAFEQLRFPQYDQPSSALIRMYLGGEFGSSPNAVNAYAASTFYAVDRFASYAKNWRESYEAGGVFVSDRYTTSNAVHQGSKLPDGEREAYFSWLYEFEFGQMGLPKPDLVICLDMPNELSEQLMRKREAETDTKADIHEKDDAYLRQCRNTAKQAAEFYGWRLVNCAKDGKIRTIEDIHEEIYALVKACLEG